MNEPVRTTGGETIAQKAARLTEAAANVLTNRKGFFICYRRRDSSGVAGRIRDRLVWEFGEEHVFFDVDDIAPGSDFVKDIKERVGKVAVVLIVIGQRWDVDPNPSSTIERMHPTDIVRLEAATALAEGARVIPVTVEGGQVPAVDQLPPKLKRLAYIHALNITHQGFESDINRLIETLRPISGLGRPRLVAGVWAGVAAVVVGLAALGYALVS